MEIKSGVEQLLDAARARLQDAQTEQSRLQNEAKAIETFIAGLELALDGTTNGQSELKSRRVKQAKKVVRARPVKHRPVIAKRGELHKSALEGFAHHDGRPMPTLAMAKYMMRHQPPSLRRKHLTLQDYMKRAYAELWRMKRAGMVTSEGKGPKLVWMIR